MAWRFLRDKQPSASPPPPIERLFHVLGFHSDDYARDGRPVCRVCGRREGQRRG